jgi:hypothetical protein
MITSLTSSNSAQRSHRLAASYVQCACLLMLGSLAVFSKPAVAGTPTYPGPGTGPAAQVAPPVKGPDPSLVPPGTGPKIPLDPPVPPKIPLPPAPTPAPLVVPPPAPAPTLTPPLKPPVIAPGPDGSVTPGAGPKPPLVPAPSPVAATPPPSSAGPTPGAGPKPIVDLAPPPVAATSQSSPTSLAPGAGPQPVTQAPASAPLPVAETPRTPTQGTGSIPAEVTVPSATAQSNSVVTTPAASGQMASLSPSSASSPAAIAEVLPGAQKLSESMRDVPAVQTQTTDKEAKLVVSSNKCIPVSFRPDSQRQGLSLVDLTGDGLIISAVPNTHIQTVFTNAGYGLVDFSQAARWCITQTAVRALVRTSADVGTQQAALLVQNGTSMQLMSKDQWLSYQASMTPVVTAMEPVIPTVAEPEVRAKPNKPNKSNKPSKPSNRIVMETRKAAYL